MPAFNVVVVVCGFVGGLIPDLLRFIRSRFSLKTANYLKSPKYWLSLLCMALLGAFVAWIFAAEDAKAAIAYGFAAPEIITRLASEKQGQLALTGAEPRRPEKGPEKLSLRSWWGT
jgi:purine-cytosine permease-like protein